ncbi:MAG: hypothetical protein V4489_08510 [Chlamydiota bacterium]
MFINQKVNGAFTPQEEAIDSRTSGMYTFQRTLDLGQCIPVFGPVMVSPVKVGVSVVEVVGGVAGAALLGSAAFFAGQAGCANNCLNKSALNSMYHIGLGSVNMVYGVSNICSLGVIGYVIEKELFKRELDK